MKKVRWFEVTKLQTELKTNKNPHIEIIANHLIEQAALDPGVEETHNKLNKSLEGMYRFIRSEAQKQALDGFSMIAKEEVYGLAQHYYDEDSIDFEPKTQPVKKSKTIVAEEVLLPEEDDSIFEM